MEGVLADKWLVLTRERGLLMLRYCSPKPGIQLTHRCVQSLPRLWPGGRAVSSLAPPRDP